MSWKSLWDRLSSPRLAAWLIGALMALTVLNVLIPQRLVLHSQGWQTFSTEQPVLARFLTSVGLDSIFAGWIIAVLASLLLLNLAVCTFRRIRREIRVSRQTRVPARLESGRVIGGLPSENASEALEAVTQAMSSRSWTTLATNESGAVFGKGRLGLWGSVLLHLCLAVLIISATFAYFTGFTGEMFIAEGQQIQDVRESYRGLSREPRLGDAYSGSLLTLDRMSVGYAGKTIVSLKASMSGIGRAGSVRKVVGVNHPIDLDGKSYLLQENGYSVLLQIQPPGAAKQYLQLNLAEHHGMSWRDKFALARPDGEYVLYLTGLSSTESERAGTPLKLTGGERLAVTVTRNGQRVWNGVLKTGASSSVDGFGTLTFEKTRLWARYMVRKQPERWWVYASLWGCLAGALWRFLSPERRVVVVLEDDGEHSRQVKLRWKVRPLSPFVGSEGVDTRAVHDALLPYLSFIESRER